MPDVAKLKKKAADFELKKQFDKALAVYVEILDNFDKYDDEIDVSLFNRVGDLYLKQGSVGDAVDYYEKAVDRYAEGGFFNNAIALCNKILRNSPGRASVYYKLGKISAQKGFKGDAKKNFLEYADRMQGAGKTDEAFRALKEFADLCPDQDDIRLMLADQLSRKGRGGEAIDQLQILYARYVQEGRDTEARATADRMKAIDPAAEPRSAEGNAPRRSRDDLVFLDLNDAPRPDPVAQRAMAGLEIIDTGAAPRIPSRPQSATPVAAAPAPVEPLEQPIVEMIETSGVEPALLDGVARAQEFERSETPAGSLLDGLETTAFGAGTSVDAPRDMLDFEPTSLTPPTAAPVADLVMPEPAPLAMEPELLDFEPPVAPPARASAPVDVVPELEAVDFGSDFDAPGAAPAPASSPSLDDLPMLIDASEPALETHDDAPLIDEAAIGGELPFIMPDGTPARGMAQVNEEPVVDLPLMDLELPMPGEATASITGAHDTIAFEPPTSTPVFIENGFDEPEAEAEVSTRTPASEAAMMPIANLDAPASEMVIAKSEALEHAPMDIEIPPTDELLSSPEVAAEEETTDDDIGMDTPPAARRASTLMAEQSVELLQALSEADPDDNLLRRRLAEAMLESGDREGGLRELEAAMVGFERADDLLAAAKVADEIVLLNPSSVRHHQKRVEYAFRTNERGRLIEAYLELADALFTAGQAEKSRAIYQRVIDLAPEDPRAHDALETFPAPEPEPEPEPAPAPRARTTTSVPRASAPIAPPAPAARAAVTSDDEYVNLGDWLRDDEAPKDTRMVVEEKEPTGDEEADFQDMLRKFKQGISENVEEEDHQSHYDLGVAYKEMGLLDEAIAEFQKALRAPANRVPTYEALGQCFIEKEQYPMASTILSRALHEQGMSDDQLVGVLYLLGRCAEERGQREQAVEFYQRVFVVDIQFRDVGERLAAVEGASR